MTEPAKAKPDIEPLNLEFFNNALLNNVGVAIAIFDLKSLEILFNNLKFHELFIDRAANATIAASPVAAMATCVRVSETRSSSQKNPSWWMASHTNR